MEYTTAFDVVQSGYRQGTQAAHGLLFVAVGVGLVFLRRWIPQPPPKFFGQFFLGFSILWTVIAFIGTGGSYSSLSSALRDGNCGIVEGIVSDFHPMPYNGHEQEWFIVEGERFSYSDYILSAGFNNTASHGGPIHKGLQVRIHHVGNDIARLEVAR